MSTPEPSTVLHVIPAGIHPDDWSRNFTYLEKRLRALEDKVVKLEARCTCGR